MCVAAVLDPELGPYVRASAGPRGDDGKSVHDRNRAHRGGTVRGARANGGMFGSPQPRVDPGRKPVDHGRGDAVRSIRQLVGNDAVVAACQGGRISGVGGREAAGHDDLGPRASPQERSGLVLERFCVVFRRIPFCLTSTRMAVRAPGHLAGRGAVQATANRTPDGLTTAGRGRPRHAAGVDDLDVRREAWAGGAQPALQQLFRRR